MEVLWAGWRSAYVSEGVGEEARGCLFCRLPEEEDREAYILERGPLCYSVLNLFPYTTGHLMVAPYRHVAGPGELQAGEREDLWRLVVRGQEAALGVLRAHGFNLGTNLGRVAGAGVPDHFHFHVVPRWDGDTNFMTTVGGARVMPEDLPETWEKLREALAED